MELGKVVFSPFLPACGALAQYFRTTTTDNNVKNDPNSILHYRATTKYLNYFNVCCIYKYYRYSAGKYELTNEMF